MAFVFQVNFRKQDIMTCFCPVGYLGTGLEVKQKKM